MKAKTEKSTLGALIRMERMKAGLTQAQLGKMAGCGVSRLSKIENGEHVTPEVADFILRKIGSEVELRVPLKNDEETTSFLMSVIYHYSKIKEISLDRAYRYLKTFKGLEYLSRFKDIEQTLSYSEIVNNLTIVCARNGGAL